MRAVLLFVALMLPVAASAEIVDLKWNGDAFAHRVSIAPKKFLEVCGTLKKGDGVSWQFNGSAPTDFNIHYHVGKDVSYPENRKQIASAEGLLSAPLDQDFCWMWSNRATDAVDVEVNLKQVKLSK